MSNFDRAIDDPGLNQDSTFDHKDAENFDNSEDFHKFDDTTKDQSDSKNSGKSESPNKKSAQSSDFDGYVNI